MQAGLPCVATRVGGNRELVRHGVSGLIVPPDEPEELAGAVARLLRDPALGARMGAEGARIAQERFPLEAMIRDFARYYEQLAGFPS
jgi:glycosyltransferase involved in cell wall biosynthesis